MRLLVAGTETIRFFRLSGKLLSSDIPAIRKLILSYYRSPIKHIVIDLKKVSYMDSAGMGMLVGLKMSAGKIHALFYLVAPQQSIKNLLMQTKLDHIFSTYPSIYEIPAADIREFIGPHDTLMYKLLFDSGQQDDGLTPEQASKNQPQEHLLIMEEDSHHNQGDTSNKDQLSDPAFQRTLEECCRAISNAVEDNGFLNSFKDLQQCMTNSGHYYPDQYLAIMLEYIQSITSQIKDLNKTIDSLKAFYRVDTSSIQLNSPNE